MMTNEHKKDHKVIVQFFPTTNTQRMVQNRIFK